MAEVTVGGGPQQRFRVRKLYKVKPGQASLGKETHDEFLRRALSESLSV